MRQFSSLLTSLIIAAWIGAIAVISVQNFTPVSLKFLRFESFQIPVGLVLAFSVGLGIVGMALVQPLLRAGGYEEDE
jgi:uncharacterized integral membrane protein